MMLSLPRHRRHHATARACLRIAIDINAQWSDYWRWRRPVGGKSPHRNRIPGEIVEIFEKYGFIWGGKWYHCDTMHFEYGPELLP
jgi:hypothetical protein